MQDRTRMAKDERGSIRQLWHVLQMVQFFTHTSIDVQHVQEPDLDSTVVTTVRICLWAKHNSEDICKTMSLFVRRLTAFFVECEETGLWVYTHVWEEQRVSHIQWRQTGHQ